MLLFIAGFCFILPLFAPSATKSQVWKALSFENYVVTFQFQRYGDFGLVYASRCLENRSHCGSNHYQNTDKPKVASQPATARKDPRHGIPT